MFERQNVILSALRLMRAMRRHPPRPDGALPPAVERFLCELAKNEGASSRDMCELMDMRPSSMSELIARMEADGFVERETDPDDRRVSRIRLCEQGREAAGRIMDERGREAGELTGCLSDEEAQTFCELCDRLTEHMNAVQWPEPPYGRRPFHERHPHCGGRGPCEDFDGFGDRLHDHGPRGPEEGRGGAPRHGDGRAPKTPRRSGEEGEWTLL